MAGTEQQSATRPDGVRWKHLVAAVSLAVFPATGAGILAALVLDGLAPALVLLAGVAGFAFVHYRRPSLKRMLGAMLLSLSVEAFLSPLALLVFGVFHSDGTGRTGGVLAVVILVVGAVLVVGLVGSVLYLLSRRLTDSSRD